MKRILYTSADVREAVVNLFRFSAGRRFAITAFVGEGAEAYLPKPKGLNLICWPKEGGTNPDVLRRLAKRGANVFFADALHMKVYWSEDQGAIITSANLSTYALGSGNLKEIGILLPPRILNVDRLIQTLKIRPMTKSELRDFDRRHKEYAVRNRGLGKCVLFDVLLREAKRGY
jgi:phosphatidylserine/phosphatidylglycerophosphate/cardiolipin synthase-like enzyme